MKCNIIIFNVIVLFISGFINLQAQPKKDFNFGNDRIDDLLKLSDNQREKFTQLHFDHKDKVIQIRSEIMKNRLEIEKLMLEKNFDQTKLLELLKINDDLKDQIHESKVKMMLNIYDMLDDSQKEIWRDHIARSFDNERPRTHTRQRFDCIPGCAKGRIGNLDRSHLPFHKHLKNDW